MLAISSAPEKPWALNSSVVIGDAYKLKKKLASLMGKSDNLTPGEGDSSGKKDRDAHRKCEKIP